MPPPIRIRRDRCGAGRRLRLHGTNVFAGHLDVRDTGAIERFLAEAEAASGPADILVNAAGTTAEQPVVGHSDDLWLKIIDTNLNGAFRDDARSCCRAWSRAMGSHHQHQARRPPASAGRTIRPTALESPACWA